MIDMTRATRDLLIRNAAEVLVGDAERVASGGYTTARVESHVVARFIAATTGLDHDDPLVVARVRNRIMVRMRQLTRPPKPRMTASKAPTVRS